MNDLATLHVPPHWGVSHARLKIETFSSRIWSVDREDGTRAVIKELKPFDDMADELRGVHYLSWRAGVGAVRLFGVHGHSMLLEDGGDRLLSRDVAERGDEYATDVIAEVLAQVLSPSETPPPAELQPLTARFSSLFERARVVAGDEQATQYREAAAIASELLADPLQPRPLHADLHHDNIVRGQCGWLVIDPKGVYGDPAFETANVFYSPLDRDDLCLDPARIARLGETLSRVIGQSPRPVLDFAVAYGCLSAAWHAGDANRRDELRDPAVASAIAKVGRRF